MSKLNLLLHLTDFVLSVLLHLEGSLLSVDLRVFGDSLGLDFRVANDLFRTLLSTLNFSIRDELHHEESSEDTE